MPLESKYSLTTSKLDDNLARQRSPLEPHHWQISDLALEQHLTRKTPVLPISLNKQARNSPYRRLTYRKPSPGDFTIHQRRSSYSTRGDSAFHNKMSSRGDGMFQKTVKTFDFIKRPEELKLRLERKKE
ncbi:hypothetical protein CEXT_55171 [Caerostris extrusa]|uniref:Uncharacterized protein n=1 Tax=Caerostris extrusa TaxID=172846 RepID=A0AAV4WQS0_CAEEX|nr:hypothetical protein CEXT_55171 [Caerostris extrusa]